MKKFMLVLASVLLVAGCDDSGSRYKKLPCVDCESQTGNENSGNENSGNENSGNENSGNENSGNENSGNENSGNENSGSENNGSVCAYGDCPDDLGKHCDYNSDCSSRQCVNHVCRFESKATVDENGASSGSGSGNDSGSGSGSGSGSSGISGASNLWVAGGSTPSGQACSLNQECESGLCYKGICSDDCELVGCSDSNLVCRYGRCIPITTDGGECTIRAEYELESESSILTHDYMSSVEIVGCQNHQFCCNGFCTDDKCEPRVSCKINEHCKSGECYDFTDQITQGRTVCGCTFDEECGSGMYCKSGNHGYKITDSLSSTNWYYLEVSYYLSICQTKLKVGAKCDRDAVCKLGACYNGECVVPKNAESRCDSDGDCATLTCGEPDYENRDDWEACHEDGIDCEIDAFCEDKYDDGEKCYRDENCKSGFCSEKYGTCAPLPRN